MPFQLFPLEVSMGLKRNVSLSTALGYKGQGPYLTFILHRIGGSALFVFFTVYILSLVGLQSMHTLMSNWIFQTFFLIFGLFHAINGLRITILDLFPKLIEHFRTAINIEWVVYVLVAGFALFVILRTAFGG
jgi:succinate dehydrogenase/fumarate reductase cytochrome b subunit